MRLWGLLARRVAGGQALAQLGGLGLGALVLAVEAADEPPAVLLATLAARLPGLWVRLAPVLCLVGAAGALARMRREGGVLALGGLGVGPRALLVAAALAGATVGGVAAWVEGWEVPAAPREWVRGEGGWWRGGVAVPDVPGGEVGAPVSLARPRGADVAAGSAAAALGGALGLWGGPVGALVAAAVLLVAEFLARGLVERGAAPVVAGLVPAVLALVAAWLLARAAPLFPRRWE